jgi:hypothetical protein
MNVPSVDRGKRRGKTRQGAFFASLPIPLWCGWTIQGTKTQGDFVRFNVLLQSRRSGYR